MYVSRNAFWSLAIFSALCIWSPRIGAFEPVACSETKDLIGKKVYASNNLTLVNSKETVWVYAGEPLELVEAEPRTVTSKTPHGEVEEVQCGRVKVKTGEGKIGEFNLRFLSRTPLAYNLRNPGKADQLVKGVFKDAKVIPKKMHEIRSRYGYDLTGNTVVEKDGRKIRPPDYDQVDALNESFKFSKSLLRELAQGTGTSEEALIGSGERRWVSQAKDKTVLRWYTSRPRSDKKRMKRYQKMIDHLKKLDEIKSLGYNLSDVEKALEEKPWRKGLDADPQALARIEKKKVPALQKRRKQLKTKLDKLLRL